MVSQASKVSPSVDEVRDQLATLVQRGSFQVPDRLVRFLEYIVNETLAGREQRIKAFTVAMDVFGRSSDFDAQTDPCVRTAAMRLRSELERYYLTAGRADLIMIDIPRGTYVPHFTKRSPARDHEGPTRSDTSASYPPPLLEPAKSLVEPLSRPRFMWAAVALLIICALLPGYESSKARPPTTGPEPVVWVGDFDTIGDVAALLPVGLTDEIISGLVKCDKVIVKTGMAYKVRTNSQSFFLEGTIQNEGDFLSASARLVRSVDGVIVWAINVQTDLQSARVMQAQTAVAARITDGILNQSGILLTRGAQTDCQPHDPIPRTIY